MAGPGVPSYTVCVTWTPFFTLDLVERGLLPNGWDLATRALVDAPERHMIIAGEPSPPHDTPWFFENVEGDVLHDRLPWLSDLYHGALRAFAAGAVGYPLFSGNRLRASMTLNILRGAGGWNDWHTDMTAVTGLLFATGAGPDGGGDLVFRDGTGHEARLAPRPGLFVCFEGPIEHQVAPLTIAGPRLSLALLYYRSATDQTGAYDSDVYSLDQTDDASDPG
jgi:hypothetical protein